MLGGQIVFKEKYAVSFFGFGSSTEAFIFRYLRGKRFNRLELSGMSTGVADLGICALGSFI